MSEPADHEWLLARERGEDVSNVPAEVRARYDELGALIESLPGQAPTPGWKQRVLRKIDESEAPTRRPRSVRWRWAVPAILATATIAVVLLVRIQPTHQHTTPVVTTEIRSGQPHRGDGVTDTDTWIVHVESDRAIVLRVYDGAGGLIARCPESGGCIVERDGKRLRYTLEAVLRSRGTARAVLFDTATGLPPPESMDADLAAAARMNIDARQIAIKEVQ